MFRLEQEVIYFSDCEDIFDFSISIVQAQAAGKALMGGLDDATLTMGVTSM